jgi:hypothetical protein
MAEPKPKRRWIYPSTTAIEDNSIHLQNEKGDLEDKLDDTEAAISKVRARTTV